MMPNVAEIIDALQATGMRQSEIARRTGIPQFRLSRWAGGAAPKGADDALKLRALLEAVTGAPPAPAEETSDAA